MGSPILGWNLNHPLEYRNVTYVCFEKTTASEKSTLLQGEPNLALYGFTFSALRLCIISIIRRLSLGLLVSNSRQSTLQRNEQGEPERRNRSEMINTPLHSPHHTGNFWNNSVRLRTRPIFLRMRMRTRMRNASFIFPCNYLADWEAMHTEFNFCSNTCPVVIVLKVTPQSTLASKGSVAYFLILASRSLAQSIVMCSFSLVLRTTSMRLLLYGS